MIVRVVHQFVERRARDGNPYRTEGGRRLTVWLLFIPLYSVTTWTGEP